MAGLNCTDDFIFTWIIEDFLHKNDVMSSPEFNVETLEKTEWYMKLYPKGIQSDKFIDIHLLRKEDTGPESIIIGYEISVLSANGTSVLNVKDSYKAFLKNSCLKITKVWDRNDISKNANKYFLEGTLTIQWRMWTNHTLEPAYNRCTAVTRSEMEKASFKKIIKNFNAFYTGHRVAFPIPLDGKYEMVLRVERSGQGHCFVIRIRDGSQSNNRLFCKISLLSSDGLPLATKEDEHNFSEGKQTPWNFPPFTELEKLKTDSTFLKNDALSLYCEIVAFVGKDTTKITEKKYIPSHEMAEDKVAKLENLSENLYDAYLSKEFTDIELRVSKKSFFAHRFLLSARSPAFKNIFLSDMFKNNSGIVDITDVDVEIMEEFLEFLYTGSLEEIDFETATKLFAAAYKYEVTDLKKECLVIIKKNISPLNVCDIANFSKKHQEQYLNSAIEECFCLKSDEIFASEAWKKLVINDISLATEMLQKLTRRNRNSY